MIVYNNQQLINLRELCQLINRSSEAVRMLIARKKLKAVKVNNRLHFDVKDVQSFYAAKKGLPRLDTSEELRRGEKFYNVASAAEQLGLGIESTRLKIRKKLLRAFCSVEGEVFVPQSALTAYIEGQLNDFAKNV